MNFEGLSDSAVGYVEGVSGRGSDRLSSATVRHGVRAASDNYLSDVHEHHQQAEALVAPRSLLLYAALPRTHHCLSVLF